MEQVTLKVKIENLEDATNKANELADKLKEARTLAGELAAYLDGLSVKFNP